MTLLAGQITSPPVLCVPLGQETCPALSVWTGAGEALALLGRLLVDQKVQKTSYQFCLPP